MSRAADNSAGSYHEIRLVSANQRHLAGLVTRFVAGSGQTHDDRRVSRRYRSLLWQWARHALRPPTTVEVEPWPAVGKGQVAITRGGHATMVVRYHDMTLLFDPILDRFCSGVGRAEACGLAIEELEAVDLILISSADSDHLHRPSLAKLTKTATIVLPLGCAGRVRGLGFERVLELQPGHGFSHRTVDIATGAGVPDSLIFVARGDGPSVLFCGQSGESAAFEELGLSHSPDVALLPIGGYSPKSFRQRHLTPASALEAFESLRARVFIPHRYGAFALSYETLDDPERWLADEITARCLERYVEVLPAGASQLLVPPRGRAQTSIGTPRRPLGRGSIGDVGAEVGEVGEMVDDFGDAYAENLALPLLPDAREPRGMEVSGLIDLGPTDAGNTSTSDNHEAVDIDIDINVAKDSAALEPDASYDEIAVDDDLVPEPE